MESATTPAEGGAEQPLIRVGTRGSQLARMQTGQLIERLRNLGQRVEEVVISTRGDNRQDLPIAQIGDDGVFVRELERGLLDGRIDAAVHSLKDLPTAATAGLDLACVPARATPFDVLISRTGVGLRELPPAAVIGTASVRRRVQLKALRPDLDIVGIRGNVDSRLRRLEAGSLDAVVLAAAGLERLGYEGPISAVLKPPDFYPAVAQGALVIQIRADDLRLRQAIAPLDDADTHRAAVAERALLAALAGGCLAPIGSWGRVQEDRQLHLGGRVLAEREDTVVAVTAAAAAPVGSLLEAENLGRRVAEDLLSQGAGELLEQMRQQETS